MRTCSSRRCKYRAFEERPQLTITCATCGTAFTTARTARRYCSADCRWEATRRRPRKSPLHKWHRQKVLERDGWLCYLCSRPIPRDLVWPHPLSATVDHVIPVSAGGSDRPDNLRAAHWHCNEEKGDRLPGVEVWVPESANA